MKNNPFKKQIERLKMEKALLRVAEQRDARMHKPDLRYLFWEATLLCNMECRHCGSDCTKAIDTSNELTGDEIKRVLKEVADAYNPRGIMLAITGGEPLLRKDLFEIMSYASSLGFPWGMVTNAYNVTPEKVEEARRSGMKTLVISIDGVEEDHNWLRGRKESYARAVEAVKLFQQANFVRVLQVTSTITRRNIARLEEMLKLVLALKVDHWRLLSVFPNGRAEVDTELILSDEEYRKLLSFIADARKRRLPLRIYYGEEGFLGHDFEGRVRGFLYECRAGTTIAGIWANGEICACPNLPPEFIQGNIRNQSFVQTWEKRFEIFRDRSWMKQWECKECAYWDFCLGNSLHLWDFSANRPKICHLDMLGVNKRKGVIKRILGK
ncbi:MAG: TIGR04133 family radical SAM/SPASM protein [Myxococcota bacterium]